MKCYGLGLEPLGCIVNKPADFTIDAQGAGKGELKMYAQVRRQQSYKILEALGEQPEESVFVFSGCGRFPHRHPDDR